MPVLSSMIARYRFASLPIAFVVSMSVAPVPGVSQGENADTARRQMAGVRERYVAAMKTGDAQAIRALYTPDARFAGFGADVDGSQIVVYWTRQFQNYTWVDITWTAEEQTVTGDSALAFSVWNQRFRRNADGGIVTQRLRSIEHWKRQPDGWKLHRYVVTIADPRWQQSESR